MLLSRRSFVAIAGAAAVSLRGQQLGSKFALLDGGGANVVSFASDDGLILVDSGAPGSLKSMTGGRVTTLFNTHYHLDQTGNNEMFGSAGARIIAHERTREYMATEVWNPAEDRYIKPRPKAAQPTETFQYTGSMKAGSEQIDYGYLILAHTSGDIYVHFKNANILAVGDVASPLRDPSFDWFTGAWIGGRVDAMDNLLKITDDRTRIVPAYGPVMSRAEFKAERDVMEEVRARLFKHVREGDGPKDMLEEGVMKGLARTWKDPETFLYSACKGLWAHNDKLDANVV